MKKLYNGFTEEKWEKICTHPYFENIRKKAIANADEFLDIPAPYPHYSYLHMFETTGNRTYFEGAYFNLEHRLRSYYLAYKLTGDEKYIMPLADTVWIICGLESWALSAHVRENETLESRRGWLELGSCLLGWWLAEMLADIGDKLPELVVRKLKHELRERIIEPYKTRSFGWMRGRFNWAAVCISGILGTFLYEATPEEIEEYLPRMMQTADSYLTGFDAQGCCREGYGYWLYGFSHFCLFAEHLKNYTDGKINYFEKPMAHMAAKFQENIAMNEKQCVSFADSRMSFSTPTALSHFLKNTFPDVQIPSMPTPEFTENITYLLWIDPDLAESEMHPSSITYSEAQWFIHRTEKYTLACKAGSNNEPHNHNDIGTFIISKDGRTTFTDPGGGAYTRQYFSNERYNQLLPSSRSHSVPIINGSYQVTGDERSEIFVEEDNEYAFSMQNGYQLDNLKLLKRDFLCTDEDVTITDTYEFTEKPESVIERFSTLVEPKFEEGKVTVGASVMEYDPTLFDVSLTVETVERKKDITEPLYLIDLKVKAPAESFVLSFKFR